MDFLAEGSFTNVFRDGDLAYVVTPEPYKREWIKHLNLLVKENSKGYWMPLMERIDYLRETTEPMIVEMVQATCAPTTGRCITAETLDKLASLPYEQAQTLVSFVRPRLDRFTKIEAKWDLHGGNWLLYDGELILNDPIWSADYDQY